MPNGTAAVSARENCPRGRGGSLHMSCPTHNSSEHYVQMLLDPSTTPPDFTVDGIGAVSYIEMVPCLRLGVRVRVWVSFVEMVAPPTPPVPLPVPLAVPLASNLPLP